MNTNEIYTELAKHWAEFSTAHNGTKKRNRADARKAIGELKKLVTPYRQASVTEGKA